MLDRLLYVAELDRAATDIDVHAMLATTRILHRRLDITGLMVRSARHVAQVLEGRAQALAQSMDRVGEEPLQGALRVVSCRPVERRRFGNWAAVVVRRYDLAADIAELHRTGGLRAMDVSRIVDRLVLSSVDDLMPRMLADIPRPSGRQDVGRPRASHRRPHGGDEAEERRLR